MSSEIGGGSCGGYALSAVEFWICKTIIKAEEDGMRKLWRKGLAIIGLLMVVASSLTGCAWVSTNDDSVVPFGTEVWSANWDFGWESLAIGLVALAIIGIVVYLVVKAIKKKDKK